jgi:hypothetical protein
MKWIKLADQAPDVPLNKYGSSEARFLVWTEPHVAYWWIEQESMKGWFGVDDPTVNIVKQPTHWIQIELPQ